MDQHNIFSLHHAASTADGLQETHLYHLPENNEIILMRSEHRADANGKTLGAKFARTVIVEGDGAISMRILPYKAVGDDDGELSWKTGYGFTTQTIRNPALAEKIRSLYRMLSDVQALHHSDAAQVNALIDETRLGLNFEQQGRGMHGR